MHPQHIKHQGQAGKQLHVGGRDDAEGVGEGVGRWRWDRGVGAAQFRQGPGHVGKLLGVELALKKTGEKLLFW